MYHRRRSAKSISTASRVVHARLDPKTQRTLVELASRTGLGESELVRKGLQALASQTRATPRRIVGIGKFESGNPDLGSNKKHLRGFGGR